MKTIILGAALGFAAAAVPATAADAATFVLRASTHDAHNRLPISYDAVLTTGVATPTVDGDRYDILAATGTATYDGLIATIAKGSGSFTLNGGNVALVDAGFALDGYFGFGGIQKGRYNYIGVSEVGGPIEMLSITPQAAAVPEPATWAMMLIGLGAVGYALRRRGKVAIRVRFA